MTGLGDLPGGDFSSRAYSVSGDGSVIVGTGSSASSDRAYNEAFIWNPVNGMLGLQNVLEDHLGLDLAGWTLTSARDISFDSRVITGEGINPQGNREAWLVQSFGSPFGPIVDPGPFIPNPYPFPDFAPIPNPFPFPEFPFIELPDPCAFGGDASCNTADLDALYAVFNTSVPSTGSLFDLNFDNVVDAADLSEWLSLAAHENGHSSPYLRGDTDLDRDVDLTDYNSLATNFDPSGSYGPYLWQDGNFDGDGNIDLSDYNALVGNFAPVGYGTAAVPEPSSVCLLLAGLLTWLTSCKTVCPSPVTFSS